MSQFRESTVNQPPLCYFSSFLGLDEANFLFDWLIRNCQWSQEEIWMYGRMVLQPRLTCWFGQGMSAISKYSLEQTAQTWEQPLQKLKEQCEAACKTGFNSCLVNYYRNGDDSVSWHADDEKCLGESPVIASVSLGVARTFRLRRKDDFKVTASLELEGGSLLLMQAGCQTEWEHCVPKRAKLLEPRINLTFRKLANSSQI